MYAFGFGQPKAPKSVAAKTVFVRCSQVIEDFTEHDVTRATALIEMRNEELHTGRTPLEGLRTHAWLVDYYRLLQTLLTYLRKDLEDLLEEKEASAATRIVEAANNKILGEIKRTVANRRKQWRALTTDERKQGRAKAAALLRARRARSGYRPEAAGDTRKCPACSTVAWISGEVVRVSAPRAGEDAIVQTFTKLPTGFVCAACELSLDGEAEMHAAGLDDLYEVEIGEDPASYYGIDTAGETSPEDYYDAYGND